MGRDFLREFGPERRSSEPLASGGEQHGRPVMDYQPPVGPSGLSNDRPGLGGRSLGNRGSQESRQVFGDGSGGSVYNGRIRTIQGRHE